MSGAADMPAGTGILWVFSSRDPLSWRCTLNYFTTTPQPVAPLDKPISAVPRPYFTSRAIETLTWRCLRWRDPLGSVRVL